MVEWREKPDIGCMSSEGPARRREGWQKLISEHKQSGLTVKAFCQKHGVGEALFYSWRKRVAAEDQPARFALVATNRVKRGRCHRGAWLLEVRMVHQVVALGAELELPSLSEIEGFEER